MGVHIEHAGESVVLRMGPVGSVLAVKGRLDIPASHITSVQVMNRAEVPSTPGTWLRAPGTFVPGLVRYGSYGREPHREFWLVFRQKRVVVVDVRDWAYHRLVIGTGHPDELAAEIKDRSTVG